MRPFRERDPLVVGAVALAVVLAAVAGLLVVRHGRWVAYSAAFAEVAGLEEGAAVRVAGVRVGEVTGLDLEDGHVRVAFRLGRDVELGRESSATIGVESVAGTKFVALAPDGPGRLTPGAQIPLARTASPYDVAQAVNGLSRTVGQLDTAQLGAAFDALSGAFADTPDAVRGSLRGLSRLSTAIAARDGELRQLVRRGRAVTGIIAARDVEFRRLLTDGSALLTAVTARRDAIGLLLTNTIELARQLSALVAENRAALGPALGSLRSVAELLRRDKDRLDESIRLLGPYVTAYADALGAGPWLDVYLHGLGRS